MTQKPNSLKENIRQFESKQIVISLLGLLIFLALSIIANRLFIQSASEQTANLITRMVQVDDFREVSLTLQSARLDYFHKIEFKSKSLNRSFTFPPLAEYVKEKSFLDSILFEKIALTPASITSSDGEDKIIFEYNRFSFIPYALGFWLILNLVSIPQTSTLTRKFLAVF